MDFLTYLVSKGVAKRTPQGIEISNSVSHNEMEGLKSQFAATQPKKSKPKK